MKTFWIRTLLIVLFAAWSCGKDSPEVPDDPGPAVPTTLTLSSESVEAASSGGSFPITVNAPVRPSAKSNADWVSIKDGTYKDYSLTYTLEVKTFNEIGEREAIVTVTSGSLSKTVNIKQKGLEIPEIVKVDLATELVTPHPIVQAQALYNYLLSQYGKNILSSTAADVAWNSTVADYVFNTTGKYPAINCFDFIHICVPENNWINYNDISPVKNWADAGGIVSLMWHFNVPLSETTVVDAGGNGLSFYSDRTSYKASNALKEGTWENKWFYEQLEKTANVILKLQDEGIAALWRPFHEAAGNYYALKWKGSAWFWWGDDGPEVCKQLWNAMYDYFTAKGIRNLIWVWTAQNYNGDMSSFDSDLPFYPGDGKVDVVARDIYGGSVYGCGVEFAQLQNAYPHKMIALGECGYSDSAQFPSLSDGWNAGAKWSWFMPWSAAGPSTMVSAEWWKDAFSMDYVITRDEIKF